MNINTTLKKYWTHCVSDGKVVSGRSQTTLTSFLSHLPPSVDIFYLINVDKKSTCLDYLTPSSCKHSFRTTPKSIDVVVSFLRLFPKIAYEFRMQDHILNMYLLADLVTFVFIHFADHATLKMNISFIYRRYLDSVYMIIRCGRVVRDFEREAKTRCIFQFR